MRFRLFFVAFVEQISTLHYWRSKVVDSVPDMLRQQLIQTTDKLLLFEVTDDVIQGDPVIAVFFLAIHDLAVGELHTLTAGALDLGVLSDADSIEATNVNVLLDGFATRLARLAFDNRLGFVTRNRLTKPTGGVSCRRHSSRMGRHGFSNGQRRSGVCDSLCNTFGC
jgi:hypothetical protein